jgi:(p)ppGpp synthase/HD superfamily hydrolase
MLKHPFAMPFLTAAENRDTFFTRIAHWLPRSDPRFHEIEEAYNDAKIAFQGRLRDSGIRYFEHLRAVALMLIVYLGIRDYELIIAALLHDIVEDDPRWTVDRVREKYGRRVALIVDYASTPRESDFPGCSKEELEQIYHDRFDMAGRDFFIVKMSDRLHNLITIDARPAAKRRAKILETEAHYLKYARQHGILYQELLVILKLAKGCRTRPRNRKT